eukprot:TRINITY_DN16465_c0_g2_i2.p1 TRINITY_DN16465_c0_g2~~TRINITY_DN16465_c0_g2_i2.p1  ORF type:complete len:343 (+),score=54.51 TRINITY_DN16465_c0_g2_i2:78-1106(+)
MGWQPPDARAARAALGEAPAPVFAAAAGELYALKQPPDEDDWLADNNPGVKDRKGQTFAQFCKPRRSPLPKQKTICLVPLGNFEGLVDVDMLQAAVSATYGLPTRLIGGVPEEALLRWTTRASRGFGTQLKTADCHTHLGRVAPADAFATVGFSMLDLYNKDSWNFVFGQACAAHGTGVFSFARYRSKDPCTFLRRCIAVLTHEIGHLFGFSHCVWHECLMNGSNGDWESDRRPLHLCPVCLRKLAHALRDVGGLRVATRAAGLADFWERAGVGEEAAWHRAHAAAAGAVEEGSADAAPHRRSSAPPSSGAGAAPRRRSPPRSSGSGARRQAPTAGRRPTAG